MEKPRHGAATPPPLEARTDTRCSVWSVLSPCLFYNPILEDAVVTDSLSRSERSGYVGGEKKKGKKKTNLGGRTETDTTSGRGSKLYIFKCKNQTDKIFVNIKFLVCLFVFWLFF